MVLVIWSGAEQEPGGQDSTGEPAGRGVRQRPHRHQRQLVTVRQVPWDDLYLQREGHGR